MKKILDSLYNGAGWLAAFFMVGTLVMVLTSVLGRMFDFHLRGSDAYAGYCMAGVSFLALAQTLKRGEHIRVTLILHAVGVRTNRIMDIACTAIAVFLSCVVAWFSIRLVWQSYIFFDISQGTDATPLWIPQLVMAIGTVVLAISFVDEFVSLLFGDPKDRQSTGDEPVRVE